MSETTNPPEEPTSEEAQADKGAPEGFVPEDKFRSELSEAIKRRDSALRRAREAEAKVKQFEEQQFQKKKEQAVESGNTDEQRKLFQAELQKVQQEKDQLLNTLEGLTLENQVKSKLAEKTNYVDDAWQLLRPSLSTERNDDGLFVPVVKTNPYKTVDEHISEFLESRPYFAANQRKPGTGVPENGTAFNTQGKTVTFEQMDKLPQADRVALQRKDKKLAEAYTQYRLNKSRER